jgi:hypothetical protein
VEDLCLSDCGGEQLVPGLLLEPLDNGFVGLRPQDLGNHIGIKDEHGELLNIYITN